MIMARTKDRTNSEKSHALDFAIFPTQSTWLGLEALKRCCVATDLDLATSHVCLYVTLIASQMT